MKIRSNKAKGFTLIELMIGSAVMLVVILGALSLYNRSNRIAVDQQQLAELQHDVRSAMFFCSRDVRMAGSGLAYEFAQHFIEGTDNESQGATVTPDRLKIIGNMENPLNLGISEYQGSAAEITINDYGFEQYPYPDEFYTQVGLVLVLPNPESGCLVGEIRQITHVTHASTGTNEGFNFSPGLAPGIDPPGGLSGTCPDANDYDGGTIAFVNVKEYWLDITGNYPGLTAGLDGYIGNGEGGILYLTENGLHYPLARNVEDLQFEYNGDLDNDDSGILDGFSPWQDTWTEDQLARIDQVRIWIIGRTEKRYVSVSGTPPSDLYVYRRPQVSNSSLGDNDMHRRFMLDSTVTIRNMSMDLYNFGER